MCAPRALLTARASSAVSAASPAGCQAQKEAPPIALPRWRYRSTVSAGAALKNTPDTLGWLLI